jgi:hypothetical protein
MKPQLLFLLGFLCVLNLNSAAADEMRVASIEAFLVYGYSGKISANIADLNGNFSFWNSIINDADGQEPADDVLIIAHFEKTGDGRSEQVSITAREKVTSKLLDTRKNLAPSFINGKIAAQSLLLHHIGCTNFDVIVSVGKVKKSINLPFKCGE